MSAIYPLLVAAVLAGGGIDVSLQDTAVSIAPAETRRWTFPAVEAAPDQRVVLHWEARMDSPGYGGSMFFMEVRVNDKRLDKQQDRLHTRLINKPPTVTHPVYNSLNWCRSGDGWRIVYAPDFDHPTESKHGAKAYQFAVDITDLVSSDDANTVSVLRSPGLNETPLVVRSLAVRTEARPSEAVASNEWRIKQGDEWSAAWGADGGFTITVGDRKLHAYSLFSKPGGGWYRLGAGASAPGQEIDWSLQDVQSEEATWQGRAESDEFGVQRVMRRLDGRIEIVDTITNLSDRDLGWHVKHELTLGPHPLPIVHLAGDPDPASSQRYLASNPTAFAPMGAFGAGLVIEDDVMRAQGSSYYDAVPPRLGFGTARFALAPGMSYSFRWAVYAMPHADYFDFINRVRVDWQVGQFAIEGPYVWGFNGADILATPDDKLIAEIARQNIYAFSSGGGWVDWTRDRREMKQIGFGLGVMQPEFDLLRADLKAAANKIHRLAPRVKVIFYNHCYYNEPEPADEAKRFRDAWITNADGRRFANAWSGRYTVSLGIYPTLTNSFGTAFLRAIAEQMRNWGADGVYMDEFSGPRPITYNTWDGYTADLDPATFAIVKKCAHVHLLCEAYKIKLVDQVQRHDGFVLGNGQPVTMAMNRQTFPRFTESHNYAGRAYESHLYTPIAYGRSGATIDVIRERLALGILYCRVGLNDPTDAIGKFFPITVEEIHAGWIKGKERIVTMHSGTYGWANAPFRVRVYCYRNDGVMLPAENRDLIAGKIDVNVPDRGLAIIERVD